MTLGESLGKCTWLGLAVSIVLLMLWVMTGALLITKETLPASVMDGWLYGGCTVATLLAGLIAGKGRASRLRPLIIALLLYAALWIAALASSQPLEFADCGLWITAAVFAGGLLASLLQGGQRRKKRGKRQAHPIAKRRKRTAV